MRNLSIAVVSLGYPILLPVQVAEELFGKNLARPRRNRPSFD
jgi:hypothetical protein